MKIQVYDATLREGAQSPDISLTLQDKLRIAHILDELGVDYVEAGNPYSNPKDTEFYREITKQPLSHAKLVAFGSTCRVGVNPADDGNVRALLESRAPVIAIFGKSWDFHAEKILGATLQQNLDIIHDTIAFFKSQGREVVFDAEHFFDGFKNNAAYAMQALNAAAEAGADYLCLCDTNGGCFPFEISGMMSEVTSRMDTSIPLGIHAHNDTGMAEANTVIAVRSGARMVQVTLNGWGERCGNADLFTTVPNLQLKLDYHCIPENNMKSLCQISRDVSEMANMRSNRRSPYVGRYAFSHKAGMHIDAVAKTTRSFEHIEPDLIGAERRVLVSEVAGRLAVLTKLKTILPGLSKDSEEIKMVLDNLKQWEFEGYQYEGADASFELAVKRLLKLYEPFFELRNFRVMINEPAEEGEIAAAMITVRVHGEDEIAAASGNGPVHALDAAARKALNRFYPVLSEMYLSDYKVRVLDSKNGTASKVRVLIESSDAQDSWTTLGVSADIINASYVALVDSLEYKLLKEQQQ